MKAQHQKPHHLHHIWALSSPSHLSPIISITFELHLLVNSAYTLTSGPYLSPKPLFYPHLSSNGCYLITMLLQHSLSCRCCILFSVPSLLVSFFKWLPFLVQRFCLMLLEPQNHKHIHQGNPNSKTKKHTLNKTKAIKTDKVQLCRTGFV